MRKAITLITTLVIIAMMTITSFATTSDEWADVLYNKGKKYGLVEADKIKLERYFADHPVTDAEANSIEADLDAAIEILSAHGIVKVKVKGTRLAGYDSAGKEVSLSKETLSQLKYLVDHATSIAGVTLVIEEGTVVAYDKNGKYIGELGGALGGATSSTGKLVYTGNDNTVLVVVSSLAAIALVALVAKRKLTVATER